MRWAVLFALASGACRSDDGESCKKDTDCTSLLCFEHTCQSGRTGSRCELDRGCEKPDRCKAHVCTAPSTMNGVCDGPIDCAPGLACIGDKCLDDEGQRKARDAREEKRRKAQAIEDTRMLTAAGVEPTAEVSAHPPGAGTRVRTVEIKSKTRAFAACRADERMIGGGCNADRAIEASYPSGHSREDTVGARWNCTVTQNDREVTAYALCAKLP